MNGTSNTGSCLFCNVDFMLTRTTLYVLVTNRKFSCVIVKKIERQY